MVFEAGVLLESRLDKAVVILDRVWIDRFVLVEGRVLDQINSPIMEEQLN